MAHRSQWLGQEIQDFRREPRVSGPDAERRHSEDAGEERLGSPDAERRQFE